MWSRYFEHADFIVASQDDPVSEEYGHRPHRDMAIRIGLNMETQVAKSTNNYEK